MVDVDVCISNHLKEELAWAVDKWLQVMYYLNPTTSRLSLLLHKSEAKRSVNNNDNL